MRWSTIQENPCKKWALALNKDEDSSLKIKVLAGLALYFSVHVLVRVATTDSLGYDEAAQMFLARKLCFGYLADPPLYSWLQFLMFQVLGTTTLSLSILKNALLYLSYAFYFLSARLVFQTTRLAVIATLSLLLIPEIAWEAQRDLTHSVLATTLSSMTLYVVLRLTDERATWQYVLLGIVMGLGILSKYNYLIFALAALITLFVRRESRTALLDKRIFISMAIALLVAMPHLIWMATYRPQPLVRVFKQWTDPYHFRGLLDLLKTTLSFLTPLWIIYLILFPRGFLPRERQHGGTARLFDFGVYLVVLEGVLITLIVLLNLPDIRGRWLQPLLFLFPLYYLGYLNGRELPQQQWNTFLGIICVAVVLIPLGLLVHNMGLGRRGRDSVIHYPFYTLASELRKESLDRSVIVTNNLLMAGNLKYQLSDSSVVVPGVNERDLTHPLSAQKLTVIWDSTKSQRIPENLSDFLRQGFGPAAADLPVTYKKFTYGRQSDRYGTMGLVVVPLARSVPR